MTLTGTIKKIFVTQEIGSNGFRKREAVITTKGEYPEHIVIEFIQDKCALLNDYKIGQDVTININLRGREWINPEGRSKFFNTIQGWNIKLIEEGNNTNETIPTFSPQNFETEEELPF